MRQTMTHPRTPTNLFSPSFSPASAARRTSVTFPFLSLSIFACLVRPSVPKKPKSSVEKPPLTASQIPMLGDYGDKFGEYVNKDVMET